MKSQTNHQEKRQPYVVVKTGYKPKPEQQETPKGVSLAIPDDSYTVRELLQKHTQGIDPAIARIPYFDEDVDHDSLDKTKELDLFEREELLQQNKNYIQQQEEKIKTFLTEKEKLKAKRASASEPDADAESKTDSSKKRVNKASEASDESDARNEA